MGGGAYHYRGEDRNGQTRIGTMFTMDLVKFVHLRFRNHWRSLSVTHDGRPVAGIGRIDGRRRFWVEEVEPLV